MLIAMIARALPRVDYAGGVSGQVHLLATALVQRGHRVTVFALNGPPERALYEYRQIAMPRSSAGRQWAALYQFPWLVARLQLDGFDIVHTHGDDHLLHTPAPVVRTFYGHSRAEARNSTRLRHRAYHLSMVLPEYLSQRRAAALVAISASTCQELCRPATVIPCGYDPTVFFPAGPKSSSPSILFVGDLHTRKRAELLLDVFARIVRPSIPETELWMVTTDPASGGGVRWFGRLSTPDLADLYRQAWVFCLPSQYEGFGVPYIEAMACGTPVVATPNGGAEEILDGGRWGRLAGEKDLGRALMELLASSDIRQAMAERGLERAQGYEIALIAGQYEQVYTEAMAKSAANSVRRA